MTSHLRAHPSPSNKFSPTRPTTPWQWRRSLLSCIGSMTHEPTPHVNLLSVDMLMHCYWYWNRDMEAAAVLIFYHLALHYLLHVDVMPRCSARMASTCIETPQSWSKLPHVPMRYLLWCCVCNMCVVSLSTYAAQMWFLARATRQQPCRLWWTSHVFQSTKLALYTHEMLLEALRCQSLHCCTFFSISWLFAVVARNYEHDVGIQRIKYLHKAIFLITSAHAAIRLISTSILSPWYMIHLIAQVCLRYINNPPPDTVFQLKLGHQTSSPQCI